MYWSCQYFLLFLFPLKISPIWNQKSFNFKKNKPYHYLSEEFWFSIQVLKCVYSALSLTDIQDAWLRILFVSLLFLYLLCLSYFTIFYDFCSASAFATLWTVLTSIALVSQCFSSPPPGPLLPLPAFSKSSKKEINAAMCCGVQKGILAIKPDWYIWVFFFLFLFA